MESHLHVSVWNIILWLFQQVQEISVAAEHQESEIPICVDGYLASFFGPFHISAVKSKQYFKTAALIFFFQGQAGN